MILGNWRHQHNKRRLHLWPSGPVSGYRSPICGATVRYDQTDRTGRRNDADLCENCMVNAIGHRDYGRRESVSA
jgi:hypothetical protein